MNQSRVSTGVHFFLMYSNRTEILGLDLEPNNTDTKALAPISKITMVTAIDFYSREYQHQRFSTVHA